MEQRFGASISLETSSPRMDYDRLHAADDAELRIHQSATPACVYAAHWFVETARTGCFDKIRKWFVEV
jgi:hypothetical protein